MKDLILRSHFYLCALKPPGPRYRRGQPNTQNFLYLRNFYIRVQMSASDDFDYSQWGTNNYHTICALIAESALYGMEFLSLGLLCSNVEFMKESMWHLLLIHCVIFGSF